MPSYPVTLTNLDSVRVVVIGGGDVANRKVKGLIDGGAHPELISPEATVPLQALAEAGKISWIRRVYQVGDLAGAFLAVAATNDAAVNAQIASEARTLGILANIGDDPTAGNATTTATVRRGDLLISVTTNGASPAMTARIRRELEAQYGDEYAMLLSLLREIRSGPARTLAPAKRTELLRQLASDKVLDWLRHGEHEQIHVLVERFFDSATDEANQTL